ncbi:hypothetical protein [Roseovarius sp. SYSU LYC5161]|uniref:hypothetical protein n=1 Tax=Roseovarius halophilus (ex Wu et al. 2025) TaxID=3376060 RepID=UPI00399A204A
MELGAHARGCAQDRSRLRPQGGSNRAVKKQEAIYLEEITDGFQARRVIKDWMIF